METGDLSHASKEEERRPQAPPPLGWASQPRDSPGPEPHTSSLHDLERAASRRKAEIREERERRGEQPRSVGEGAPKPQPPPAAVQPPKRSRPTARVARADACRVRRRLAWRAAAPVL